MLYFIRLSFIVLLYTRWCVSVARPSFVLRTPGGKFKVRERSGRLRIGSVNAITMKGEMLL